MLAIYDIIYTIATLFLGAIIGSFIKNFQENINWSGTRNATYDLIASDLGAIGGAGIRTFLKESSLTPRECLRYMHNTHPRYGRMRGRYGVEAARLGDTIRYFAWTAFDERHGKKKFNHEYSNKFYFNARRDIDKARSDMRVLVSIPGDMKVKMACIDFEQAATRLFDEHKGYSRINITPPIQESLRFLGKAAVLCEILNEVTHRPGIIDRLNSWWLTGDPNSNDSIPDVEILPFI